MGKKTTEKVRLDDLDLAEFWQDDDDDMEAAANFPYIPPFPANAGLEAENHTVVYGEVQPEKELATHTEDRDELLVIPDGTAEVTVRDDQETLGSGELLLIPADEPHRVRNIGSNTVRYLGVFPDSDMTSELESELQPVGSRVV